MESTLELALITSMYGALFYAGTRAFRKLMDFVDPESSENTQARVYVVQSGGQPERTYDFIKKNADVPYRIIALAEEDDSIKTPETAQEANRLLRRFVKTVRKSQANIYVVADFKEESEYEHFLQLAGLFGVEGYLVKFDYSVEGEDGPRRELYKYESGENNKYAFVMRK